MKPSDRVPLESARQPVPGIDVAHERDAAEPARTPAERAARVVSDARALADKTRALLVDSPQARQLQQLFEAQSAPVRERLQAVARAVVRGMRASQSEPASPPPGRRRRPRGLI